MGKVKCQLCKREFELSGLGRHISRIHKGIDLHQYYCQHLMIGEVPVCAHPDCNNPPKYRNMVIGYKDYCSIKCSHSDPKTTNKRQKTCYKNYGVTSPLKSKIIQDRMKRTMIEVYGVENPSQSDNIKKLKKSTMMDHYGVENPSQSDEIQAKKRLTFQNKYGTNSALASKEVHVKIKSTIQSRYGVDNVSQIPDIRKSRREQAIKRVEDQLSNGEPPMPRIGELERECLNELESEFNLTITRCPKRIGYFPDGLIESLKVIIEFDEEHHFLSDGSYVELDQFRHTELEKLGYIIIRIKKHDWLNDKESVKLECWNVINGI